jgi:hypothetical protein
MKRILRCFTNTQKRNSQGRKQVKLLGKAERNKKGKEEHPYIDAEGGS